MLLIAPAVWLLHFIAVYLLLTMVCAAEAAQRTLFGLAIVELGVGIATIAAVALIAGAAWAGHRRSPEQLSGHGRFLGRASVALACLSVIGVLWVAYPAFVLQACESSSASYRTGVSDLNVDGLAR